MTVRDLKKILDDYPADAHVVVAVVPNETLVIQKSGQKLDIHDAWHDGGCLNIIATTPADQIDLALRRENELEENDGS